MKKLYLFILSVLLLSMSHSLFAQTVEQEAVVKVVVTDDGVLFNGEPATLEAVPELFWQALQRNPKIKYSISAKSSNAETIKRMQQLSTSIMEYISEQRLVGGAANNGENSLRIDIKSDELIVRRGAEELHQLLLTQTDSLRSLVRDFIACREIGEKRHFALADGTEFDHAPNDALVVTMAKERGAVIDSVAQIVARTIAEGYDSRRNEISEQVVNIPYHELDNTSRSVFMAAVPKRTQSNLMQTMAVRQITPAEDNRKAVDLLRMCLLKADGTFAWEGKSYKMEEIVDVLGVDFDTSKLMLDDPLVGMIMEKAFGDRAPKLDEIDTSALLKILGFSMPNLAGGIVNMVAHSVKVIKDNPELVDAYVPIAISDLDFVALDAAGNVLKQPQQSDKVEVRFTIVGNESCRSGVKKLTLSIFDVNKGEETLQHCSADYQNVDLPVAVPVKLTSPFGQGTYLVSVHRGKKLLGVIEVEMFK